MSVEYNPGQRIPHPAMWGVLYKGSTPFWEGVKGKKIMLQRCKSCGYWLNPPRPMCPKCQSQESEWVAAKGTGKVYSWVTFNESPHSAFKAPYAAVLIELDEGPRIVSNVVGINSAELKIGMPVEVTFEKVADDLTLPKFRKVG